MATPDTVDLIAARILLDGKEALKTLSEMDKSVASSSQKLAAWATSISQYASKMKITIQQAADEIKKLNSAKPGKVGLLNIPDSFIDRAAKAAEYANKVAQNAQNMGNSANSANKGILSLAGGFSALKVAMGVLTASIVGQMFASITNFFTGAIDQARQLEASLYRLKSAERILSEGGIEVTTDGLKQGIADIKELLPIFSKEDITQTVGAIAISTKQLGLTEDQIIKLAKAAAIYNVQSVQSETLLQSQAKLVDRLISPQAKSIGEYGIAFSKVTMEAKALEMGILRAGEAVADLTDQQKAEVKFAIIMEGADKNLQDIGEYLDTNSAKLEKNAAAWKDLQTAFGNALLPFIPALTAFIELLTSGISAAKTLFALWASFTRAIFATWDAIRSGNVAIKDLVAYFKQAFGELVGGWLKSFFPEVPDNAPEWFKKLYNNFAKAAKDTPTKGLVPNVSKEAEEEAKEAEKATKKLQDIMKENAEKLADIERDYKRKIEDINRDYANKISDIARDTANKRTEAEIDYAEKIEDINRDANEALAEAQEDYRKKERDREAEFQQKLKELREKFLFDLEDALRERDARQVLRLIRQYNADKQNLIERNKLEKAEDANNLKEKLADIEIERQQKLAAARREYEEKIREIAIGEKRALQEAGRWHRRQLEDARLWYQRQLADQREFLKRKLEDLRASYSSQLQMASQFMNSLNGLLTTGTGGSLALTSAAAGAGTQAPGIGSGTYNPYDIRSILQRMGVPGYAEGGTVVANKPTLAMFGERGPEAASFTPLNRTGANVGKVFGDTSGLAPQGRVSVEVNLSPDLEGRIVNKALNETADVVLRVNRSKL